MEIFALSPVFGVLLAISAIGGLHRLVILLAAMMPFGMFAVINLSAVGDLSLLAVNLVAATLVACGGLGLLSRLVRGDLPRFDAATLAVIFFAAYSVFSATVLVRLFAGETMVFALSRGAVGTKVSVLFSWEKIWLGPSNSNISQTFYVVLACGLFLVLVPVLRARGAHFGARCMALAAGLNVTLGLLDLAAADPLLSLVRTANYSLANEASVSGIPRVIGGFSEAASFSTASAMFFAYFASAYLGSGRLWDGLLALCNGIFILLALSSTGFIAFAVVCCALLPRLFQSLPSRMTPARIVVRATMLAGVATAVGAALTLTEAPTLIMSVVENLILDKSTSSSGLERRAWAIGGLEALRDTWGLGAGTGSLRSNGLLFVLLGSVGVIGTAAFIAFLWFAFGGRAAPGQAPILANARTAALAVIVSMMLSATVPDPGVPLIFLAALAVATRHRTVIHDSRLPSDMVRLNPAE